jgi:ribosomal-protein-alanine N-acetyltransferase
VTIIPAGPAHLAVLEGLHAQCFDDGWTAEDFGRLLATPGTAALIALDGAEPVGLALTRAAADECELLTIGVLPAVRRRHVGRALLEASLATARSQGAVSYFLDVAEDNPAACRLYYSVGFTQVGRRPNYYRRAGAGVAALVMALDLHGNEQSPGGG